MTTADILSIVNLISMPMWALMILGPNWKLTLFLIDNKVIPVILSTVYAIYIFLSFSQGGGMNFGSLESVMQLFTLENAVLAGWVHYLAFDLLIGMLILNKNREVGLHHLIIVPCLICTFMLGPIGFLLFISICLIKKLKSQWSTSMSTT